MTDINYMLQEMAKKDIFITGLEFGEDEILVTYQERREIVDSTAITKQMILLMDTEDRQQMYLDLQSAIADLVDDGYITLRNPEY